MTLTLEERKDNSFRQNIRDLSHALEAAEQRAERAEARYTRELDLHGATREQLRAVVVRAERAEAALREIVALRVGEDDPLERALERHRYGMREIARKALAYEERKA